MCARDDILLCGELSSVTLAEPDCCIPPQRDCSSGESHVLVAIWPAVANEL
jgi:hypothetical protein